MADIKNSTASENAQLLVAREENAPAMIRLGKAIMNSGRTPLENEALKTAYEKTTKGITQMTLESNKDERKRYEDYVRLIGSHIKGLTSDARSPIKKLYDEVRDDVTRDAENGKLPIKEMQFALRTVRRFMEEGSVIDRKKNMLDKGRRTFSPTPPLTIPNMPKRNSNMLSMPSAAQAGQEPMDTAEE